MGFFSCLHTLAWDDVGFRVWVPQGLGQRRSWRLGPAVLAGCAGFCNVCLPGSSWRGAAFLLPTLGCGCVVLIFGACSFPCWRTWAAGDALARFGSLVIVPLSAGASFLFGPGASLGWALAWELGFLCLSVGLSSRGYPPSPWLLGWS